MAAGVRPLSYKIAAVVLYGVMVGSGDGQDRDAREEFEVFVRLAEERLRIALTASFGVADGRAATVDALSWAWEHWDRVQAMTNPVGYLYRVGQSSARRSRPRPIPHTGTGAHIDVEAVSPELVQAIRGLSDQQRTAVMLVHAFGWTVRDAAAVLEVAPSTVQTHVERGLARLRTSLEEHHAH